MEDWSREEVALIVSDYFQMLLSELRGEVYSKADHRRRLLPRLNNRSSGSIEFKHQNISAVLKNLGYPFIKGYKYRENYQQMLFEEVEAYLDLNEQDLKSSFESFSSKPVQMPASQKVDFDNFLTDAPERSRRAKPIRTSRFTPRIVNYLEKEQNNRDLGESGERLIIEFEKARLLTAGMINLISGIKWISKESGDGAGYDILSKNEDGSDRFIEVKTTKLTKETPIFITRNEVEFAKEKQDDFYLYRVFNFEDAPGLFIKRGEYRNFCNMEPESFKGVFM